ncbi:MAG: hypothetical protein JSS79_20640 [Bacteroidetes bacterium]|nr:hypothetical protein [Bacteroidota bacterium]
MIKIETLFVTNRDDISVEYLISKLRTRSTNYLRLNSDDLDRIEFQISPNTEYVCNIGTSVYDLNSVRTIIFKRTPTKFYNDKYDPDSSYLNNERKHFLEGLYLSLGHKAKWINPMFATHIAERKLFQLKIANQIGFTTPKSIITNSPLRAKEFLHANSKTIIKPVSNGLQVLDEVTYSIYTSVIDQNYFDSYEQNETFETPVFLQEMISNKADIRVTIVKDKVFVVRIDKVESEEVDWRKPDVQKKYSVINLPENVNQCLLKLNHAFDLVYSAIDLIQTPNDDYVFLEVNPVGEWVWLEKELGLNISDALINEFYE